MSMVEPIGLDALPALSADEVARRNTDLATFGRALFTIGGSRIGFARQEADHAVADVPGMWLVMDWNGQPCLAGISAAWADVIASALVGQSLAQLGDAGLELLGHTRLADSMPAGLNLRRVTGRRASVLEVMTSMREWGTWQGRHVSSGELSGHWVQLWGDSALAMNALAAAMAKYASHRLRSPLSDLPIALPLVAAKWHVPLHLVTELDVGDVLLMN